MRYPLVDSRPQAASPTIGSGLETAARAPEAVSYSTEAAPVTAPAVTESASAERTGARSAAWWRSASWWRLSRELLIVGAFCAVYELLRTDMVQDGAEAGRHALDIVRLETGINLFHEESIQAAFLRVPDLVRSFNLYYGATHFVVPVAALVWLALRHPDRYPRARNLLATVTGIGFICFWLFPVAPPRLLPARFGIIDTLVTLGKSGHFTTVLINSAGDVYAAMPSLHVAWALWSTVALYPVVRHRVLRVLLVAYPALTTLVVVTTGNHFFFDAAAGAILVCVAWVLVTYVPSRLATLARTTGLAPMRHRAEHH
ncbi:MAG TPA: phosphatase PAP2 family protein [Acidimicrobiales bacterium]